MNNNIIYIGKWKDDHKNEGAMTYQDGKIYVEKWKYNRKNVQGIITLKDGTKYIEEFKNGRANGQRTETFKSYNLEYKTIFNFIFYSISELWYLHVGSTCLLVLLIINLKF